MHPRPAAPIHSATIFANPRAGRGNAWRAARAIIRGLRSAGIGVKTISDLPADATAEQLGAAEAAIIIGGDGTVRAVARAFLDKLGHVPPLLPVPVGTANLMGRHLGIDWHSSDVAQRVAASLGRGQVCQLDAASANGQLLLLMAGIGIDGHIVHELNHLRKGPINYASYLLPAAMTFASYQYPSLQVHIDGQEVFPSAPAVAFVGNVSEYGIGFSLVPGARSDDGLLDVCVIPVRSRGDAIQQFLRAVAGEHVLAEGVVYARGKHIQIQSPQAVPVQVDGDPAGYTPLSIDLLPQRVPFIVPA